MANLNTGNFSDAIKTYYEKRLLTRALPRLVHARFGMQARVNRGFGSLELRKYTGLSAVTTPLTSGVTPSEQAAPALATTTITPLWYGAWLGYTDKLDLTNFDPIVSESVGILGEQAGLSIDTLIRTTLVADSTLDYSNGISAIGSLTAVTDKISFSDILIQVAELEAANARPIGGTYKVICHPYTMATLFEDDNFVTLFTREGGNAIRNGLMGRIFNMDFYVTSNAKKYTDEGASSADPYSMLFIAAESYGSWGLANLTPNYGGMDTVGGEPGFARGGNDTGKSPKPVEIIMMEPGSAGSLDPLKQRGTIAWKCAHDDTVLNSAWIRNLIHINSWS